MAIDKDISNIAKQQIFVEQLNKFPIKGSKLGALFPKVIFSEKEILKYINYPKTSNYNIGSNIRNATWLRSKNIWKIQSEFKPIRFVPLKETYDDERLICVDNLFHRFIILLSVLTIMNIINTTITIYYFNNHHIAYIFNALILLVFFVIFILHYDMLRMAIIFNIKGKNNIVNKINYIINYRIKMPLYPSPSYEIDVDNQLRSNTKRDEKFVGLLRAHSMNASLPFFFILWIIIITGLSVISINEIIDLSQNIFIIGIFFSVAIIGFTSFIKKEKPFLDIFDPSSILLSNLFLPLVLFSTYFYLFLISIFGSFSNIVDLKKIIIGYLLVESLLIVIIFIISKYEELIILNDGSDDKDRIFNIINLMKIVTLIIIPIITLFFESILMMIIILSIITSLIIITNLIEKTFPTLTIKTMPIKNIFFPQSLTNLYNNKYLLTIIRMNIERMIDNNRIKHDIYYVTLNGGLTEHKENNNTHLSLPFLHTLSVNDSMLYNNYKADLSININKKQCKILFKEIEVKNRLKYPIKEKYDTMKDIKDITQDKTLIDLNINKLIEDAHMNDWNNVINELRKDKGKFVIFPEVINNIDLHNGMISFVHLIIKSNTFRNNIKNLMNEKQIKFDDQSYRKVTALIKVIEMKEARFDNTGNEYKLLNALLDKLFYKNLIDNRQVWSIEISGLIKNISSYFDRNNNEMVYLFEDIK